MTKRQRIENRRKQRDGVLDFAEQRRMEEEQKQLLKDERRTVRENYDNAAAVYKSRKRRRRLILYAFLAVLLIGAGILAIGTLFFKIKEVRVVGNLIYDEASIIQGSGVEIGQNLFSVDPTAASRKLCAEFPYIQAVSVERKWPSVIQLKVEETYRAYVVSVAEDGGFAVLSPSQKVLEIQPLNPEGVCIIEGVSAVKPEPGQPVQYSEETDVWLLNEVLTQLANNQYTDVTCIDLRDSVGLKIDYDDRIQLALGSASQLDYKLRLCKFVLDKELDEHQRGTLTVRENGASFLPKSADPVQPVMPEPDASSGADAQSAPRTDEAAYDRRSEGVYTPGYTG